jgi:AhpC/TSA family
LSISSGRDKVDAVASMRTHRSAPQISRELIRTLMVVTLGGGLLEVTHASQPPSAPARSPIDVSRLGPQVGDRVPDFDLKDQNGKSWTLNSLLGAKGAMLVFFRSADW